MQEAGLLISLLQHPPCHSSALLPVPPPLTPLKPQRLRLHALFADARRRILNHRYMPTSAYWRLCARPSSADAAARWAAASAHIAALLRHEDEEAAAMAEDLFAGEGATSATETEDGPWTEEDADDAAEAADTAAAAQQQQQWQQKPPPEDEADAQGDYRAEDQPLHRGASEAAAMEEAAFADE